MLLWLFVLSTPDKSILGTHIYGLNVGQGDSILIRSSLGNTLLIDTGPDSAVVRETQNLLGFGKKIDVVLITHPDKDHIGGLIYLLDVFHVSQIVCNLDGFGYIMQNIPESYLRNTSVVVSTPLTRVQLDEGLKLEVIWPYMSFSSTDDNYDSMITLLTENKNQAIFMADVPQPVEHRVLSRVLQQNKYVQLLKAGHHGSKYSSSWYFVESLSPKHVLLSAGKDNRYHHPSSEVVRLLTSLGVDYDRTDVMGTIEYKLLEEDNKNP